MSIKIISVAAVFGLLAFLAGTRFGNSRVEPVASSSPADTPRQLQMLASLRDDNQRLSAELAGFAGEAARLKAMNATLAAEKAVAQAAAAPRELAIGVPRWQLQEMTMKNLRQIDAGRKAFQAERGRSANSIHEIIGRGAYLKTMRTVAGEDYSKLPMDPTQPMTVSSDAGGTVTFDPSGATTTKYEYDVPPEVLNAKGLELRVQAAMTKAVKAYRLANEGNDPPNERALVAYFPTPKEGADYVEFLEAKRAAGL